MIHNPVYMIHTPNGFLVEHDGIVLGAVYLAEDARSWYAEYLCKIKGEPVLSDLFVSRGMAADVLVRLHQRGKLEEWKR